MTKDVEIRELDAAEVEQVSGGMTCYPITMCHLVPAPTYPFGATFGLACGGHTRSTLNSQQSSGLRVAFASNGIARLAHTQESL